MLAQFDVELQSHVSPPLPPAVPPAPTLAPAIVPGVSATLTDFEYAPPPAPF
jgi:hypothetical protein